MDSLPIGDYALLSDCHSAALVSRAGSVDWLCLPRFDAPSVFCRVLDPAGGHFAIRPAGEFQVSRRYVDQTMVLETTFTTAGGTAVLTDALATGRDERGHHLGADSPGTLLRSLACTEGEFEAELSYAPRPEYGLVHPILFAVPCGLIARGGATRLLLSTSVSFAVENANATARMRLAAGQTAVFALAHGDMAGPPLAPWTAAEITERLADTMEGWRSWSAIHQNYEGPWRDLVRHSGRVLQAMTFAPTGAIVAAPTTSLPETVGGGRNWDYRYTWVRDASLTMEALWVAACPDEANKFFAFLANAAGSGLPDGADLQIMFGIGGERDLSERELPHLSGWRGSRPVRVGNGAWLQRQLDVYGELLDAAQRLVDQLGQLDPVTRQFLAAAADAAATRWREKDQGIWEIRGEPRDFLYSKLMCWVAVDRAIALAAHLGAEGRVPDWETARDEIRAAILTRGWNERAGAYTQAFGSEDLDASNLMLTITGFLAADDPRMKATIDVTAQRLTDERGLVYRYLSHDGLGGDEGTFVLCTFWLAHAQALAGDVEAATATFERALAAINDVGLLAEEIDLGSGEMIGNFPQAFSHIGLVNAAWAITQAQQGPGSRSIGLARSQSSGHQARVSASDFTERYRSVRNQITSSEICRAVACSTGPNWSASSLIATGDQGIARLTAATTAPARDLIGAAIDRSPLSSSSSLTAMPVRRTWPSSVISAALLPTERGPRGRNSMRSSRSLRSGWGRKASSALPVALQ
jgi:alpha,alpha-trehalase